MLRNRIGYAALLLVSAAASLAIGTVTTFTVLFAVAMLPLFSFVSLALYPFFVTSRQRLSARRVIKGEAQPMEFWVRNRGFFNYPCLSLKLGGGNVIYEEQEPDEEAESGGPGEFLSTLGPRGMVKKRLLLTFRYRGVYDVGLESATVTDFLGIFRMKFKKGIRQRVVVFPKIMEDFALPISQMQIAEGSHGFDRFSDDYADVTDMRKYDPADDFRKIHWKLTAKRGEFIVKNFHAPGLSRTMVFIDTAKHRGAAWGTAAFEDLMASLAASSLDICLKNRQMSALIYGDGGEDIIDVDNMETMENAMEVLAMLSFSGEADSLLKSIGKVFLGQSIFDDVVIFASSVDRPLCSMAMDGFSAGHATFFYYVYPHAGNLSQEDQGLLEELVAHGVQVEILR